MIDFEEYTKDTYDHVPEGYEEYKDVLEQILDKRKGCESGCALDGWEAWL